MTLGETIRRERLRRAMTLDELAAVTGMCKGSLSMAENDRWEAVGVRGITVLAANLGGDPDQWCGLTGRLLDEKAERLAAIAAADPSRFRWMLAEMEAGR